MSDERRRLRRQLGLSLEAKDNDAPAIENTDASTLKEAVPDPSEVIAMSASQLAKTLVDIGGIRINETAIVEKIRERQNAGDIALRSWGYGQEHEPRIQAAVTTALEWLNDSLGELLAARARRPAVLPPESPTKHSGRDQA